MLKYLLTAATLAMIVACNNASGNKKSIEMATASAQHNSLTEKEKQDGWQLLFDGKSTTGWHKYGGDATGAAWKVQDSSLFFDASVKDGGGDIVTDEEYDNFHLKLEWKVDLGANSGIILFIHEDKTKYRFPWETGPEMQVLDNERHPDAKIVKHRAGDLYDLISCSQETVRPALEWNQVEIKSLNGKLDFYLNGVNVVSTTLWDDAWRQMVAKSKFRGMKDFATYKKGRLGLQDHGDKVWFRNIRIKKL